MRYGRTILLVISTLTFAMAVQSHAQVSLYPQVSAETNAMGGAGVSFVSDNALATIANPAELALFSLHGILSASYMPPIPGQLNAYALDGGVTLNRYWQELPLKVSLGVGYSNPNYSYPEPGEGPTNGLQTDVTHAVTFALGVNYTVKLGLGYTLQWVNTRGVDPYYHSTFAPNWGAILQVPVMRLVFGADRHPVLLPSNTTPFFNVTIGFSQRNVANYNSYGYAILPREGDLGWNFELGLERHVAGHQWKWLSFILLRQADSPLSSAQGRTQIYDNGLSKVQLYSNLVEGFPTGEVSIEKGWQIGLAQFIYVRGGSATGPYVPTYETFGWGLRLDGLFQTLAYFHLINPETEIAKLALDHFDLRFDYSNNPQELTGFGQTKWYGTEARGFTSMTLVLR